jgi:hypothetical protein
VENPIHAPLFAGFECARLHWNQVDLLEQTDHVEGRSLRRHYREALDLGVRGFRDGLPGRCNVPYRIQQARKETGPDIPIVWDIVHFDRDNDPLSHAREVVRHLGPQDRLIAVNEPSVGEGVSGRTVTEAVAVAAGVMTTTLMYRPEQRFWTCDPMHHLREEQYVATDALVALFPDAIEVVGINYYPHHTRTPLREIIQAVSRRYNKPVAITETGLHAGHPHNWINITTQRGWWEYVNQEIAESGCDVRACCWYPWLATNWDGGAPWPNDPQFFWEGYLENSVPA